MIKRNAQIILLMFICVVVITQRMSYSFVGIRYFSANAIKLTTEKEKHINAMGNRIKNAINKALPFSYLLPQVDETPPKLDVLSPTDGQEVANSTILVSGSASDKGSGDNGISSVMVNGERADNDTAIGTAAANWSKTIPLQPGENKITVIAKDNSPAQNPTKPVIVTVIFQAQSDTMPPTLDVISPTEGEIVTKNTITVTGSASDKGSGDNGISSVTVNEESADGGVATKAEKANWSKTIALKPGENIITVVAKDDSPNKNASSPIIRKITYQTNVNTPPTILPTNLFRQEGNPSANATIANVNDAEDAKNTLQARVNGNSTAMTNGVTVSNLSVSASGVVTADVVAACGATTATFSLTVTDSGNLSASAPLTVTVNPNTPPVLSYNNQSVNLGGSLTVNPAMGPTDNVNVASIVLQGSPPNTFGGVSVNNSTGVVSINNATPAGNYTFTIRATDNCGKNTDATFTLGVGCTVTNISAHPANQTVCVGSAASFSVSATGSGLTYQWQKNNSPIGNAIGPMYSISSVAIGDAASYNVVITDACGNKTTSNAASLTVSTPPSVTTHPTNQSASTGGSATFTAAASGTPSPSIQWQVSTDGGATFTNINGQTNTTLTLSSLALGDNGKRYRAVFTNGCGSVPTNAATLSVSEALTITKHPSNLTLCPGQAATFSVTATGANLSYQWQKNGVPIQGAIASTYNIPSVSTTDSGNYAVVVTSGASLITSNSAVLTVNAATAITVQPLGQSKIVGQSVTFSVTAAGANLGYQWRRNGSPINAATNSSFTIPSVSLSDAADYDVVVSGSCGSVTSNVAKLTVACPTITVTPTTLSMGTVGVVYSQSFSQTGGKGNVTFDLTGTLPSGLSFSGNTLAGTPSQVGSFSIIVKASDENRCMGSRAYTLVIVTPPPTITSLGPTSKFAGDSAFTLTVTGKDFVNGAKVLWNGSERATTFVDSMKLTATILGSDIASVANAMVTVLNPLSGSVPSNAMTFTILLGYEADVAPAGMVDGRVTIADWVKIGGIYIGNDTVAACSSELQRADCFPKETRGDGKISIGDWVQAGRYAAGLDPMVPAGGTLGCATLPSLSPGYATFASELTRTVRVKNANFVRGQIGTLEIELDAQGNENAAAFTLHFDPKLMSFVTAKLGEETNNAFLQINTSQAANGRIGLAIMLPAGQQLAAGTSSLLTLRFIPNGGDGDVVTNISFSDQLLAREVVDALASPIPQVSYVGGAITIRGRAAASVSAASYVGTGLAADSIASAFGTKLATMTAVAAASPLPTMLGGTSVKITDAQGVERISPLFFVSPNQINYQIPEDTAVGIATVTITNGAGEVTLGLLNIGKVAPGVFSADSSGKGWAAADVVYVKPDQSQVIRQVARFDVGQNRFVPVPIDLSTDAAVLVLYGTGVRHRAGLANVKVKIDGVEAAVEYADRQEQFAGLDQINVRLPKSLAGRGEVNVEVSVEGKPANPIRIMLQ